MAKSVRLHSSWFLWAVTSAALIACSDDISQPDAVREPRGNQQAAELAVTVGSITRVRANRVDVDRSSIASKARRAARAFLARPVADDAFNEAWEPVDVGGPNGPLLGKLADAPSLRVLYNEKTDDLSLDDLVIQGDTSPAMKDEGITENQAIQLFYAKVQELASLGLLSVDDFDLENLHVGYMEQGLARSDQPLKTNVYGYIVRALRRLNRLPVRNSLVALTIHRSGVVAGIRLLRSSYHLENAETVASTVTAETVRARFNQRSVSASVEWEGPSYFLPDSTSDTVEPVYALSYSGVAERDGIRSLSRRLQARYSLTDPARAPTIIGGPNGPIAAGPGDSKK